MGALLRVGGREGGGLWREGCRLWGQGSRLEHCSCRGHVRGLVAHERTHTAKPNTRPRQRSAACGSEALRGPWPSRRVGSQGLWVERQRGVLGPGQGTALRCSRTLCCCQRRCRQSRVDAGPPPSGVACPLTQCVPPGLAQCLHRAFPGRVAPNSMIPTRNHPCIHDVYHPCGAWSEIPGSSYAVAGNATDGDTALSPKLPM